MILKQPLDLQADVTRMFAALGAPLPVAERIATGLVESNLVGHDSHGVQRVPEYIERARAGALKLDGKIEIVRESTSTALMDCRWNLGQVAAMGGMELAMAKAQTQGVGVVVLCHCEHTGRVGEYAVHAARHEMIGQVICNGSLPGGIVAPFGGTRAALGANPMAWAIPGAADEPIFSDFATSIVAHGKLQVAADKGELVPAGWILDKHGQPTRDPNGMFDGGAILTFGGHKGYALSVMIELISGGLSGVGFPLLANYTWDQGTVLTAIDIAAFQSPWEFKQRIVEFTMQLKATPRADGVTEILLPGELEWRTRAQRLVNGIPLPELTWQRIVRTAETVGVALTA